MKKLIINILIPLGVGILSSILTMNNMDIYSYLVKPLLTPPKILFPIVWTILYTLMGISAYLVSKHNIKINIYYIQLFLNFIWTLVFFNLSYRLLAFIIIILLLISIIVMIKKFIKIDKTAAYLQIPYLVWVSFASYLNLALYLLNR